MALQITLFFLCLYMTYTLNLSSFNGNGLRVVVALNADILCLQETHWTDEIMMNVKEMWNGHIYVNHGSIRSCGVAILIKENC